MQGLVAICWLLGKGAAGTYVPRISSSCEQLDSAIWSIGLKQFGPLLGRLRSGQGVNVVVYGSSVVQTYGGCYHPSLEHAQVHPAPSDTCVQPEAL